MRRTSAIADHATIHFGGARSQASVHLVNNFDGDHTSAGLSGGGDVDVEVAKGSALANAIDAVSKLIAAAAGKKIGVPVSSAKYDGDGRLVNPGAFVSPEAKKAAKAKAPKKSKASATPVKAESAE